MRFMMMVIPETARHGRPTEKPHHSSKQCSSRDCQVRCYAQARRTRDSRVGGRWFARQHQVKRVRRSKVKAVAHRSPRWPLSPSRWHKRIIIAADWLAANGKSGREVEIATPELTAPAEGADGPYSSITCQHLQAPKFATGPEASDRGRRRAR